MRILIVSKIFPPMNGARALQLAKVVSALIRAGCEVQVVAGKDDAETTAAEQPCPVYYVPIAKDDAKSVLPGRLRRLSRQIARARQRRRWSFRTAAVCRRVLETFQPDCVLSCSSLFDSHHPAYLLRGELRIPWIAFLSDPWPPSIAPEPYRQTAREQGVVKHYFQEWFGRTVLRACDAVVVTNAYVLQLLERETRVPLADKSFVIPHIGSALNLRGEPTKNKLVHVGALTPQRSCPPLLTAMKRVAGELPDRFGGMLCVGDVCDAFRDSVRREGLDSLVEFAGHVPEAEANAIAARSRVLLIIEADMQVSPYLPSKFADYAVAGRPILAVTAHRGPIREYLQTHGGGWAVGHDADEIAHAIRREFAAGSGDSSRTDLSPSPTLASVFKAENVAGAYVDMFKTVMRRKPLEPASRKVA